MHPFQFSVLLIIACVSSAVHHHLNIAFAIEGKVAEVATWVKMISLMEYKSRVVLFLLSYDKPIDPDVCTDKTKVICIFAPKSTWTAGRNILTRHIDSFELLESKRFKYWLFGDHDMNRLDNCGEATHCHGSQFPPRSDALAACCFDVAMQTLLAPEVQYAVVNFNIWGGGVLVDYLSFAHMDCGDGSLNAFHRTAVPVILPYVELVDKHSWWEAQGVHFHIAAGCFPGYSVYSNVFSIKATTAHSPYPMGRYPQFVEKALKQSYGKLGLIPSPLTLATVQLEQGNCANLNHSAMGLNQSYEPIVTSLSTHRLHIPGSKKHLPVHLKTEWASDAWQNTTDFKKCAHILTPRYLNYIKTGDLVKTDGELL